MPPTLLNEYSAIASATPHSLIAALFHSWHVKQHTESICWHRVLPHVQHCSTVSRDSYVQTGGAQEVEQTYLCRYSSQIIHFKVQVVYRLQSQGGWSAGALGL